MSLILPTPKQIWKVHTGITLRENQQVFSKNEQINEALLAIMEDQIASIKTREALDENYSAKAPSENNDGSAPEKLSPYKIKRRDFENPRGRLTVNGTISEAKENFNVNKKKRVFGSAVQKKKSYTENKNSLRSSHFEDTENLGETRKKLIFLTESETVLAKNKASFPVNPERSVGNVACLLPNPNIFLKKKSHNLVTEDETPAETGGLFDRYLLNELGHLENSILSASNSSLSTEASDHNTTTTSDVNHINLSLNASFHTDTSCSQTTVCELPNPIMPAPVLASGAITTASNSSESTSNQENLDKTMNLLHKPLKQFVQKPKEHLAHDNRIQRVHPSFKESIKSALIKEDKRLTQQKTEIYSTVSIDDTIPERLKYMPHMKNPLQPLNKFIPVLPRCFLENF